MFNLACRSNNEYVDELMDVDPSHLPPITVFHDGSSYWLGDGFHRHKAAQMRGDKTIRCDVKNGTKRDAQFFNLGANGKHGLRRTNGDIQKAIKRIAADSEWSKLSNIRIAELINASPSTVGRYRPMPVGTMQVVTKGNGKVYTQRVGSKVKSNAMIYKAVARSVEARATTHRLFSAQTSVDIIVSKAQQLINDISINPSEYGCKELIVALVSDLKQIRHRMEHYSKQLQVLIDKEKREDEQGEQGEQGNDEVSK